MTKERLRGYRALKREKLQLERQLEDIEGALYHPKTKKIRHTPGSTSPGNAMEDLAAKHLELLDLYNDKLEKMSEELLDIEKAIEDLPSTERQLLRLYYMAGMTWEEVCVSIGYSWKQVHRIHGRAIDMLKNEE